MKARSWWLIIAALAVYAAVLYLVHPNPKATIDVTPGSSASAEPMGDLAFARLWSHLGLSFQTSAEVPMLLPTDNKAVFVSVEPEASQYGANDAAALLSYVKSGHRVVWVTSQADAVTKALGLKVDSGSSVSVSSVTWSTAGGKNTLKGLRFQPSHVLVGSRLKTADERFVTKDGLTVGAVFKEGAGQVAIWTVPAVFENQGIGQGQNLQIAWNLVGPNSVLWDEYGHGVVAEGLWSTLFGHGRQGTLLLLIAAAIAYFISGNSRFGQIREAPDDIPRLDVEFAHAITWHLSRSRLAKERERLLDAAVRRRLCTLYGMPGTASWEVLDTAVLPSLSPKLQRAYALWRTEDTQDGKAPTRSARKRRLVALRVLMDGASETPSAK